MTVLEYITGGGEMNSMKSERDKLLELIRHIEDETAIRRLRILVEDYLNKVQANQIEVGEIEKQYL